MSDSGDRYHMLWAEYNASGALSNMQVLNIAQVAANSTGRKNAVLVTEVASRAWAGLQKAC